MSKYDKMLEVNHKQSVEKIQRAKLTIQEMIEEEDKVTVPKLIQKTGLSRGFFYKNPEVRKAVDHALQVQAGMVWAAAVFSSSPFHNMDCKERKVSLPKGTEGRLPSSR